MQAIAIIDCYDSFVYNLVEYVRKIATIPFKVIPYKDLTENISNIYDQYSSIILSPGPGHPNEFPFLREIIKGAEKKHTPILGICLGMQAIALTYGAKLETLCQPLHGHSDTLCRCLEQDPFLSEGETVARYHSWIVSKKDFPEELQITSFAKSDNSPMSIRHKIYPFYGTQFHPESYISNKGMEMLILWMNKNNEVPNTTL